MVREGRVIAFEAWPFILLGLCLALLGWFFLGPLAGLGALVLVVLCLIYFRDPRRPVPASPRAVLSPVDGVVTGIETNEDEDGSWLVIHLSVDRFGAWSFRSPTEGKVMGLRPVSGQDGRGLWLRTDENDDITVGLAGPARPAWVRPVAFASVGERLAQGQRSGYRRLAHTARVAVPLNSLLRVAAGERVKAGTDILAELVHD